MLPRWRKLGQEKFCFEPFGFEMLVRHPSGDVRWTVEYINLEFRGKFRGGDRNLGILAT